MAWYADISRMRIGKPDPQPQQQYKTRELYDSLEGYEVVSVLQICIFHITHPHTTKFAFTRISS